MNLFSERTPSASKEEMPKSFLNWTYIGMSLQVLLMLGALVMALFWATDYLVSDDRQREVYINIPVDEERQSSLNQVLSQTHSIREARQDMEALAWIKSVHIRKMSKYWMISITESLPVAKLAPEGYMFADGSIMKGGSPSFGFLPRALGQLDQLAAIAMEISEMNSELNARDLSVRQFRIRKNGILTMELEDNKIVQLGSQDYMERFGRLLLFVDSYGKELTRVQSIDLRYDNAVAVNWEEPQS